jgi:hypothetical protein
MMDDVVRETYDTGSTTKVSPISTTVSTHYQKPTYVKYFSGRSEQILSLVREQCP